MRCFIVLCAALLETCVAWGQILPTQETPVTLNAPEPLGTLQFGQILLPQSDPATVDAEI